MKEAIGFLSVKRNKDHGYLGGFLVLNLHARPLEFHCTMPVKPTRAQEMLYGPTIDDFICGEQIAKALITKAKLEPSLILTDSEAALAVCVVRPTNMLFLDCPRPSEPEACELVLPKSRSELCEVLVGEHRLLRLADSKIAEKDIIDLLGRLSSSFDLSEPFQRITEALMEAHSITKAA